MRAAPTCRRAKCLILLVWDKAHIPPGRGSANPLILPVLGAGALCRNFEKILTRYEGPTGVFVAGARIKSQ